VVFTWGYNVTFGALFNGFVRFFIFSAQNGQKNLKLIFDQRPSELKI